MNDTDHLLAQPALCHRNVAELVFKELRGAILARTFPVGDRLPSETQLALKDRNSRPIMREALRSLQTLGILLSVAGPYPAPCRGTGP